MKNLDENSALAIVFANIRRKKRSNDLVTIAKSFEYLVSLYGSQKAVAEKVGLSAEMIREFLIALKLPDEVKELISSKQIDSVDVVKELSALKNPLKQITTAKTLTRSEPKDARDIKRIIKKDGITPEEAKMKILELKPKGFHMFLMDFDDEMYQAILTNAKTLNVKPAELVREIIKNWLKRKARTGKKQGVH